MHDRVALITGGGTGIGAATARALAGQGYKVAVAGRRAEKLSETVRSIAEPGGTAGAFEADVADLRAANQLVEAVAARFGRLDVLVNNAALYGPSSGLETTVEAFQAHLATNTLGPFFLAQAAFPHLKNSDGGVVVNVLSTLAHRPVPGVAAYSASKAALLSLTQTLALEWATHSIRVVAVSPGVVDTPVHARESLDAMGPAHPLGRVGTADEVAAAVRFLVSPDSAWTTGSSLIVDGGISLA